MSLNRRCCINYNENHELWRCICLKWWQQMKQAFKIYKNKSFRYFEMFKYNHALFSLFLNSLNSMNSSDLMNFFNSINLLSSVTIMLKTCSWIIDKSAWQIVKVKKRWVDLFSCVNSDSDETTSEQIQKHSYQKVRKTLDDWKHTKNLLIAESTTVMNNFMKKQSFLQILQYNIRKSLRIQELFLINKEVREFNIVIIQK